MQLYYESQKDMRLFEQCTPDGMPGVIPPELMQQLMQRDLRRTEETKSIPHPGIMPN